MNKEGLKKKFENSTLYRYVKNGFALTASIGISGAITITQILPEVAKSDAFGTSEMVKVVEAMNVVFLPIVLVCLLIAPSLLVLMLYLMMGAGLDYAFSQGKKSDLRELRSD